MVGFLLYMVVVIIMFNTNIAVMDYDKGAAMKIACFAYALVWPLAIIVIIYCVIRKKGGRLE